MLRKPRIVCVDDRQDSLAVRKRLLEQFGYDVVAVTYAQDCLLAVTRQEVDLVIIDYHLSGGIKGDELAHDIRTCRSEVPLIMLTGDPAVPEKAKASVDAVLIKGMSNPTDLLALIQTLLPHTTIRQPGDPRVPGTP